eukprot:TRINITY_DN3702_c3_g1_i2.p1 TRINITY_DN3702_c3_g1~~TRINITY_DN3702_c3_g1_i2.p1  ORF type:complete len:469 (+),score=95.51 TRINITY_DN3702_c3_g1_i2:227-1633(+)
MLRWANTRVAALKYERSIPQYRRGYCAETEKPKILMVAGPTGIGKTPLAVKLAEALDSEIILSDSVTVYKHLNIASAKPTHDHTKHVRHHLQDVVSPASGFSAADFMKHAGPIVENLVAKNKIPVICGGTVFYQRFFITNFGLERTADDTLPMTPTREMTDELQRTLEPFGWSQAYAKLQEIDPVSADRIGVNDWVRLTRSLAVYQLTGKPYSSFLIKPEEIPNKYDYRGFFVTTGRRAQFIVDSGKRCEDFVERGVLQETFKLLTAGYMGLDSSVSRAVGYKESIDFWKEVANDGKITAMAVLNFLERYKEVMRSTGKRQTIATKSIFSREPYYWLLKEEADVSLMTDLVRLPRSEWDALVKSEEQKALRNRDSDDRSESNILFPFEAIPYKYRDLETMQKLLNSLSEVARIPCTQIQPHQWNRHFEKLDRAAHASLEKIVRRSSDREAALAACREQVAALRGEFSS